MNQKAKVSIIFRVILLILSLTAAAGFYFFHQEKSKVLALRRKLETIQKEREELEGKLLESQSNIEELNAKLDARQRKIEDLNNQLRKLESEKQKLTLQIKILRFNLQRQAKLKEKWKAKQRQTQKELGNLRSLLSSLKEDKSKLEAQIAEFEAKKKEIDLGKIVVSEKKLPGEGVSSEAAAVLEGKVMVINRDYDFAIINIGSQQGLSPGDVFSVYRDGKYIGDLKVERLQEEMCALGFVTPEIENKISEADKLILRRLTSGKEKPAEKSVVSPSEKQPEAVVSKEGDRVIRK